MKQFLTELTADDVAGAVAHFAQPPDFRWYSDSLRVGPPESTDHAALPEHLAVVAATTTSIALSDFHYTGGSPGGFWYVLTRTDSHGSSVKITGKGAVDCSTGLLVVWSEGEAASDDA